MRNKRVIAGSCTQIHHHPSVGVSLQWSLRPSVCNHVVEIAKSIAKLSEINRKSLVKFNGGDDRIRTGVHGFAVRCVTTPPRRPFIRK